ncbi:cystathionine gamma-lyase [Aliikangiella sp. IMCC44359]|uniref:cystathionine gamma-lyase n=1 Tax=Aliikangiella sp. IMCC44359 TaxID=3459125 RepID=UPI00403B2C8C
MKEKTSLASKVIHAGTQPPTQGHSFNQPPVFASAFHLSGDPANSTYQYGRFNNPTWQSLEDAISELENAPSVIFPSGMAAIASVLTSILSPGDTLVLPTDGYAPTRAYAEQFLKKFGVNLILTKTLKIPDLDFTGIKLVLIESPSNPLLDVLDISLLADKIHQKGGLLAVDNTCLTPLGQQPLALGADISVCSDTKAFNGHSDILFGHVASASEKIIDGIRNWRTLSGNIPGPMETWLVHRALASLDLRLERMTSNAQALAQYLSTHPKVKWIRYPGLKNDPSYKIAKQQMNNFGYLMSFELNSLEAAENFLKGCQLIFDATSFGGMHTMAERRKRWNADDIPEATIRLSAGCEKQEDLLSDISSTLDRL